MSGGAIVESGIGIGPDVPPSDPPNGATNGNGAVETASAENFDLLQALQAMRIGDFSVRLPGNQTGLEGKIADTFNEIVAANERMARQLDHVGQLVGREGKTRH